MKPPVRASLVAALVLAAPVAAHAQITPPPPREAVLPGGTLLTVNAQGTSTRTPDIAGFTAGITTQAESASAALAQNSQAMNRIVAAVKATGVAPRDIQTSNLSVSPVYASPRRLPDGSMEDEGQRIVGYRASNTVNVRQRKLADYGKVIDALVSAGANQIDGPNFALGDPQAASDEARTAAIRIARQRAQLYAQAAGMKVVRIVSIDESGGRDIVVQARKRMEAMTAAAPPPVEAGELEVDASVVVRFLLAP